MKVVNLRLATVKDVSELAELRYNYWLEEGSNESEANKAEFVGTFQAQVTEMFNNSQLFCWVAIVEERIVSSLYIQVVKKLPKPSKVTDQFGYATNFYTVPEWRGTGIGRKLLHQTKSWAESMDLEFLIAWPSSNSAGLWSREGF